MSKEKLTSRTWELVTTVTHPKTGEVLISKEKIDNVLKTHSSIKEYAYILHDKDTYTEEDVKGKKSCAYSAGDAKPAHYHVVMHFARAQELDSLSEWFGIAPNYFEKKKGRNGFYDAVIYLTHQSEKEKAKGKFVYPTDEVYCNFESYGSFSDFVEAYTANKEKYGKASISTKDKLRLAVLYDGLSIRQIKKNTQPNTTMIWMPYTNVGQTTSKMHRYQLIGLTSISPVPAAQEKDCCPRLWQGHSLTPKEK